MFVNLALYLFTTIWKALHYVNELYSLVDKNIRPKSIDSIILFATEENIPDLLSLTRSNGLWSRHFTFFSDFFM